MNVLLPIFLLTAAILAGDPCDNDKARKDFAEYIDKKLDSWSKGQVASLGSASKACRELTEDIVDNIDEKFDNKAVWEILHPKCITDMAQHNTDVFEHAIKSIKEEDEDEDKKKKKKKLLKFLSREDGYFCKNISSFKNTSIYPDMKKECRHVETAAELAAVKKEVEELKKSGEASKAPASKQNSAASIAASASLAAASAFLLYTMF
jgi:chemotaxis protein histidine kinase CheA